jgi:hypothetical protein
VSGHFACVSRTVASVQLPTGVVFAAAAIDRGEPQHRYKNWPTASKLASHRFDAAVQM